MNDADLFKLVKLLNNVRGFPSHIPGSDSLDMFDSNPGRVLLVIQSPIKYNITFIRQSGGLSPIREFLTADEARIFLEGMIAAIKLR